MFYEGGDKGGGSASGLYELGRVISGGENISKLLGEISVSKAD